MGHLPTTKELKYYWSLTQQNLHQGIRIIKDKYIKKSRGLCENYFDTLTIMEMCNFFCESNIFGEYLFLTFQPQCFRAFFLSYELKTGTGKG